MRQRGKLLKQKDGISIEIKLSAVGQPTDEKRYVLFLFHLGALSDNSKKIKVIVCVWERVCKDNNGKLK